MKPRLMAGMAALTLALTAWLPAQSQDSFIVTTDHAVLEVSANGIILNTLKTVANSDYLERNRTPVPQTTVLTGLMRNGSRFGSVTISGFPSLSSRLYMFRRGERHLAWTMDRRPDDRSLRVSFPGEGGRSYVAALSVTGIRPGPVLPDGRVIPLIVDGLVSQSLNGGIPGVLENTVGVLNATGEARVKVHVNRFGATLKGLRLWAATLVLDAKAPSGVAAVVGPLMVTLK